MQALLFLKADEHVHGQLQLIFRASVPGVQLSGVWQVRFANQHSVAGIAGHHGAHSANHVVYLGKIVRAGIVEIGIALCVHSACLAFVAQLRIFEQRWDGV